MNAKKRHLVNLLNVSGSQVVFSPKPKMKMKTCTGFVKLQTQFMIHSLDKELLQVSLDLDMTDRVFFVIQQYSFGKTPPMTLQLDYITM